MLKVPIELLFRMRQVSMQHRKSAIWSKIRKVHNYGMLSSCWKINLASEWMSWCWPLEVGRSTIPSVEKIVYLLSWCLLWRLLRRNFHRKCPIDLLVGSSTMGEPLYSSFPIPTQNTSSFSTVSFPLFSDYQLLTLLYLKRNGYSP